MYDRLWAASLLRLLCPDGRIYKVGGCQDSGPGFDAVLALGVLEYCWNIKETFAAAIGMVREGGFFLFEVPLGPPSDVGPAEAIWYASERGLRRLVENVLGWHLVGRKIPHDGRGAVYVGIAVRDVERVAGLRALAERVLAPDGTAESEIERVIRLQLHVLYAGQTNADDLAALSTPPPWDVFKPFMARVAELWQRDIRCAATLQGSEKTLRAEVRRVERELATLRYDFGALASDAASNASELSEEIVALQERLRVDEPPRRAPAACSNSTLSPTSSSGSVTGSAAVTLPDLLLSTPTGHRAGPATADLEPWPEGRPLVSIVITSFNYARFVDDAVSSALSQTFNSLEVIVVEGGSSEGGSRLHVASIDRTRVRVLMQGSGHRAGANRNLGISQALGKYVCCLDADDILRPTYIEKAVYLLERAGFDVVSAAQELFGQETGVYQVKERPSLDDLLKANHVLTCAVFRRRLWEKGGGFRDTDISVTGHVHEDWAHWVRLAALGARFFNMSRDPLFLYRVHGISLSRDRHVLTLDHQRALVGAMNADLVTSNAREISRQRAASQPFVAVAARPSDSLAARLEHRPARARPRTVLLAMPFLTLGGAERLLSNVVGHLVRHGMHVVVVTSIPTGPALGDTTGWFDAHTAEIFHLPRFLPSELWDDFLSHLVASKEVDLLWIAGSAFAYDNLRALRAQYPGLRVVDLQFNLVGHTENNRRRRELIDLTIVESAVVRDGLLAQGETENRIRLVESGVDVERLTPALRSAEVRDEIVQASGDLIVAYCGRWSSEKAPLVFIEMARQADPAWPVRFVMTGTGPLGAEIRCAIKDADFPAGRFHLLGEIADVLPIIASADLLVIPSIVDGRPVVALEAFACGTPVVASRVGGLPALVSHGVTGWLCEPADVPDLLRSLAAAVADPGALARMRDAARRYAEEHLDIRHMFHAYEGVLVEVSRTTEHRPESIGVNSSSTAEGDLYLSGSSGTDGPR